MLTKLVEALEKTFTAPVMVAAAIALMGSVISGTYAFAQGVETVKATDARVEEVAKKSSLIEERLSTHIAEESVSRDELRRTLRQLRIEQFDANMNAYISCIVSKQKDPTLPFECRKPEPPKGD